MTDIVYWGGPVYCKTINEVKFINPTKIICNPLEGSKNGSYFSSIKSDAIGALKKKAGADQVGRIALAGFSAVHGFIDPFLNLHADSVDYVHLADACFQGAGATSPKPGLAKFAARAASGQARMTMTSNGPWGKDISYMGPAGSKYDGVRFNLTSGAKCIENIWRSVVGEPVPTDVRSPEGVASPDRTFKKGELYWFHYEGKGVKDPHGWHVNTLAAPYIQMFGAPWLARTETLAPMGGSVGSKAGLMVGGMVLLAVASIFYLTLNPIGYIPNCIQWQFPKLCACGRLYDIKSWKKLPLVGVQNWPWGEEQEIRNCICGSSITVTTKEGDG